MVEEKSHDCRVSGLLEPGTGADALQLTLRFSFRARLTASVRWTIIFVSTRPIRKVNLLMKALFLTALNNMIIPGLFGRGFRLSETQFVSNDSGVVKGLFTEPLRVCAGKLERLLLDSRVVD
jgi:hypothetical protein